MRFCCILTFLSLLLSGCGGAPASGSGSSSSSSGGSGSSADAALLGETFYLTIDDASSDLADYGSYKIRFFNGNYDAPGDGYFVADSGGTFTANIVGGNIIVKANDSELGIATWTFTYDPSGNTGTYYLETIVHGDQYGVFSNYTFLPAPVQSSSL